MEEQKVRLSDRDRVIEVVQARLDHIQDLGGDHLTTKMVASLIADDLLASMWKIERDITMLNRGKDAGYERGLKDAIGAVGEVERQWCDVMSPPEEARLVDYREAQRAVARLSSHGMEELWKEDANA